MNTIQPLNSQLALNQCSGLNIEGNQNVSGVFGNGVPVQSNSGDPELILVVKFKNNINLNQILIETGMDKEKAPEYVKVFAHRDDLDFADAEEMAPTDSFKLEGNFGKKLTVKIPKFKNLSMLCLFFHNPDADQIQVNNIQFFGFAGVANVDFAEMKKNPVG